VARKPRAKSIHQARGLRIELLEEEGKWGCGQAINNCLYTNL
jgi:hypothetical protein